MSYSPSLARWMQQDPEPYIDGLNNYQFVRSNPVNHHDPMGMATDAELLAKWDTVDTGVKETLYNCVGLALRTYQPVENGKAVRDILKKYEAKPGEKKDNCVLTLWFWSYKVVYLDHNDPKTVPTTLTATAKLEKEQPKGLNPFHLVSGRIGSDGSPPKQVYTKNGGRSVQGPMDVNDAKLPEFRKIGDQWLRYELIEEIRVDVTIAELRKLISEILAIK